MYSNKASGAHFSFKILWHPFITVFQCAVNTLKDYLCTLYSARIQRPGIGVSQGAKTGELYFPSNDVLPILLLRAISLC